MERHSLSKFLSTILVLGWVVESLLVVVVVPAVKILQPPVPITTALKPVCQVTMDLHSEARRSWYLSSSAECKVWRNPLNLLRGGEYQRFTTATGKDPLTYYDMNLSAQDHQTYFTCEADIGKQEYESKSSL